MEEPTEVVGQLNAPGSVVGPPQSVAVAPDESIALVAASTKIDPSDPKKTIPDNRLSVIDLKASPPAVIATLELGVSPAGVSFSPDGKLVLVTNRGDGTVSVLAVNGKTLTPAGKIQLGDAKSGPSHVAFLPDGKRALVTREDGTTFVLALGDEFKVLSKNVIDAERFVATPVFVDGQILLRTREDLYCIGK